MRVGRPPVSQFLEDSLRALSVALVLGAGSFWFASPHSQTLGNQGSAASLRYEVVSVRASSNTDAQSTFDFSTDGLTARNNTLMWLIQYAFGADDEKMVVNAPPWIKKDSFDIVAKVGEGDVERFSKLSTAERNVMLQAVLIDRFKLAVHREPKELPVYDLEVSKSGIRMGEAHADANGKQLDSMRYVSRYELNATGVNVGELVNMLSQVSGRFVVDRSGLTKAYDFHLKWSPEEAAGRAAAGSPASGADEVGPSIFSALKEQLGLVLQPSKAVFPALVIDLVERPSVN